MSELKKHPYPQLNFEARPRHLGSIRGRLGQFVGGHFSSVNLSPLLFSHRLDDTEHVKLEVWSAPGRTKPTFDEAKRQKYKPAKKGEAFGPSWTNHWFKVALHIPKDWEGYERVQLEFDCSGEAMVYTTDGDPIHGLTGGWGTERRVEFIIPPTALKAGVAHYFIEASSNEMFGQNGMDPPDQNRYYWLNSCDLVVPNMEAWRLMWDFDHLHQLVDNLPDDCPMHMKAQWTANEIMNVFQTGDMESVKAARKTAEAILGEAWEDKVQKESESAEKQKGTLWGIGHCHIDTAWLWPFSVTQQKSARSWSTQCDLMDRYPEHRFSATQAQQFKWVEQLYPSLFARIKEKISEGTFQPVGATWVEMDCNMPSGEALVRQFLYGQKYYQSRFGITCKTFVLPDTFGYSSQLPQIARLAGCDNFFTQKLSWNNTNTFPNSTFNWVGLDSSQILTHMTPVDNYNSQCNLDDIRRAVTNHKNTEVTSQALLLFGNGDGGGGPTPPMLEKLRRIRATTKQHDVGGMLPPLKMGGSFEQFFDSVREETINGGKLPNWRGELYAEFHRGTYTSHGSIKKGNRKSEILMREAEFAATAASLADPSYKYPKDKIDSAWEDLLLCQFHDVLPGSGIAMIYEDAEEKYAGIQKSIRAVLEEAYSVLYKNSHPLDATTKVPSNSRVFAINTLHNYPRQDVVTVPLSGAAGLRGSCAQVSADGKKGYMLMDASDEAVIGQPKGLYADVARVTVAESEPGVFVMTNESLVMKIEDGRIASIYDKAADKELLAHGQTAGMVIMEDNPNFWDAWDVDQFHLEKQTHLKFGNVRVLEGGPVRATIGASLRVGQSSMEVEISLDAVPASLKKDARSMIRFSAVVDWREKHKFLKFELPVDIQSDTATYDTQFGVVSRPTHRNTSWDAAKFEVCGHKFADYSEYGYGVAILNDCKYGYATEGNVMRLSLLRAPTQPDPETDMGSHAFSWAVYPHLGTFAESDVPQVAYAFNTPLHLRYTSSKTNELTTSPLALSPPFRAPGTHNVFVETIKRGEDDADTGKTTVVLRAFEQFGGHAKTTLKIYDLDVTKASLVNLLEEEIEQLELLEVPNDRTGTSVASASEETKAYGVKLSFRGFEVKTIKLTLASGKSKRSSDGWVKV